jgi:hypothetical protein
MHLRGSSCTKRLSRPGDLPSGGGARTPASWCCNVPNCFSSFLSSRLIAARMSTSPPARNLSQSGLRRLEWRGRNVTSARLCHVFPTRCSLRKCGEFTCPVSALNQALAAFRHLSTPFRCSLRSVQNGTASRLTICNIGVPGRGFSHERNHFSGFSP